MPLQEVTGFRGEKITELALTDFSAFDRPLFAPGFLGDKWPAIDFYVELNSVRGSRPYFFVQTKSTRRDIDQDSQSLPISTKKKDIERLLRIPGPTYVIGVHEPSKRSFITSVYQGRKNAAISSIPLKYELTAENLQNLYNEVRGFWRTTQHKPDSSIFS